MRRDNRPFSPDVNTKEAYKQIQKGGEVPVSGLRLPYPERKGAYLDIFYGISLQMHVYSLSVSNPVFYIYILCRGHMTYFVEIVIVSGVVFGEKLYTLVTYYFHDNHTQVFSELVSHWDKTI